MEKQLLKCANNKTLSQLHIFLQTFLQPFIVITMVFAFLQWIIHFHTYMLPNPRSIYIIIVTNQEVSTIYLMH